MNPVLEDIICTVKLTLLELKAAMAVCYESDRITIKINEFLALNNNNIAELKNIILQILGPDSSTWRQDDLSKYNEIVQLEIECLNCAIKFFQMQHSYLLKLNKL